MLGSSKLQAVLQMASHLSRERELPLLICQTHFCCCSLVCNLLCVLQMPIASSYLTFFFFINTLKSSSTGLLSSHSSLQFVLILGICLTQLQQAACVDLFYVSFNVFHLILFLIPLCIEREGTEPDCEYKHTFILS